MVLSCAPDLGAHPPVGMGERQLLTVMARRLRLADVLGTPRRGGVSGRHRRRDTVPVARDEPPQWSTASI